MKLVRSLIIAGWACFITAMILLVALPDLIGKFLPPLVIAFLVFSLLKASLIYAIVNVYRRRLMSRNENKAD